MAAGGEQPLRVALDRITYWSGVGAQLSPTVQAPGRRGPEADRARARGRLNAPVARQAAPRSHGVDAWPSMHPSRADDAPMAGRPTRWRSARIIDAWGVKGWIKLQPFAADPQALFSSRRWHLQARRLARATAAAMPALLHITQAKTHGDAVVAAARELADRDAADALRGRERVRARAAAFRPPATTSTTGST